MADITTEVRTIRGIGEQRAKALGKLGITTLGDLLHYFPRAYEDRREYRKIRDLCPGEPSCVKAVVAERPTVSQIRPGLDLVKLRAVDETGILYITYFNQIYRCNQLHPGQTYVFFGKCEGEEIRRSMNNPVVEREDAHILTGRIVPIYPLTAGVSQWTLIHAVEQGLAACRGQIPDLLPKEIREAQQLCPAGFAYAQIHFPHGDAELATARRRLIFEELFFLAIGMKKLRAHRDTATRAPYKNMNMDIFFDALPFSPTGAQKRAVDEICADLRAGKPMNRLVQGDVGSGKTMAAAAAMVCAVRNGQQAALMAPTEILAGQHYRRLAPLLEKIGISCTLLTGEMPTKIRRETLAHIADGSAQVVVGTHALISAHVLYADLGLVVTDEQHRFGVEQRAALAAKGKRPHLLVMSATPIPRTLALMIYGDLDVSVIDELPPGRQKIDTYAVDGSYRQRIYAFLRKQIAEGRQAYMICSLVEKNGEGIPDERKAVKNYADTLQTQVFPDRKVAFVHGRMKPKEKEAVMAAFAAGETDILVSTTVVEVGVDVPNATVMVVEDADRFGLSQLHQLRGRVGRGAHKSYCILISDSTGEEARQRLRVMVKNNNGFTIAEEDLKLRGPGDFLGRRQHGLPDLKIANLSGDMAVLQEAQKEAARLLARDPTLENYPGVVRRVEELFRAESLETLN